MDRTQTVTYSAKEFNKITKQIPMIKKDLTAFAKEFLKNNYDLTLEIPIKTIYKNSSNYGNYRSYASGTPISIFINTSVIYYSIAFDDKHFLLDVLKHELIHYALHVLGKPFSDGSQCFENELVEKGILSSGEQDGTNINNNKTVRKAIYLHDTYTTYAYQSDKEIDNNTYRHTQKDKASNLQLHDNGLITYERRTKVNVNIIDY